MDLPSRAMNVLVGYVSALMIGPSASRPSAAAPPTTIGAGVTKRTVGSSSLEKRLLRWALGVNLVQSPHPLMRQHPQQSPVTGAFLAHLLQQKEVTVPDDLRSMPLWFVDPATHFRVSQVLAIRQRGSTEEYLVEWVDNDAAVDAEDEQLHSNDPPPTVAPTVALSDQYQTWEPFANIPGTAALINKCREAIAEANLLREQETQKKKH
jgi:hypothetical protein